jgi:hypothetical protein
MMSSDQGGSGTMMGGSSYGWMMGQHRSLNADPGTAHGLVITASSAASS